MRRPRVMTIGPGGGPLERLEQALNYREFEVDHVNLAGVALKIISSSRPVVIIVSFPLSDMGTEDFFAALDRRIAPLNHTKVILLADEHYLTQLRHHLDERHLLLSPTWKPELLLSYVRSLLPAEMKPAKRLMLRLEVEMDTGLMLRMCQSENISETGMLVRTHEDLPVNTQVQIAITLPSQEHPVKVRATIVRHTHPERERFHGLGVKFLNIQDQGLEALRSYLQSGDEAPPWGGFS